MTKQVTDICHKVKEVMTSNVQISVLLINMKGLIIIAFCLEIYGVGKWSVQILLETLADSFNKWPPVISQLIASALMWQTSTEHLLAEFWSVILQAIKKEQKRLVNYRRIRRKECLEIKLTSFF